MYCALFRFCFFTPVHTHKQTQKGSNQESMQSGNSIVQSLNSPFFPPNIGAEPGRAKEESRITCMRMLRTNQSKISRSQRTAPLASLCRAMPFSARALKENIFFDVDVVVKKYRNVKIEIWFIVVCTLIDNEYIPLLFSQTFRIVSVC